ncbi:MAG: hypothetical protein IJU76_14045 [Desulfovibrionaceae bacterium]|nr:hypothetical protein [Desulfovibrionaceae bacterium]
MDFFLVDFENVHINGLAGIQSLSQDSRVIVFYSRYAHTLTIETHIIISQSPAKVSYEIVDSFRKNDLDIQLSSYLGYLIRENAGQACSYYIVSHDNGFKQLISFWRYNNVFVIDSIKDHLHHEENENILVQPVEPPPLTVVSEEHKKRVSVDTIYEEIKNNVQFDGEAEAILDILINADSKVILHEKMQKYYKNNSKKVGKIYKKIKKYVDHTIIQ